jgi:chromate transporter
MEAGSRVPLLFVETSRMPDVRLPQLFLQFLRLGATAYGGPAMMAYLRQQCVERYHWLTEQEFKEGMAFCHLIPGATMMQMAAYVGYRLRGPVGALMTGVAFILPAFLLMVGLSAAYFASGEITLVKALFRGLAAVVVAIILNACVSLRKTTVQDWRAAILAGLAFAALAFQVNLLLVLLGAALLAMAILRQPPTPAPAKPEASR